MVCWCLRGLPATLALKEQLKEVLVDGTNEDAFVRSKSGFSAAGSS